MRFLFFLILFIACDIREVKDDSIVAKVGESELKKSDLADVVPLNISESDSIEFVAVSYTHLTLPTTPYV